MRATFSGRGLPPSQAGDSGRYSDLSTPLLSLSPLGDPEGLQSPVQDPPRRVLHSANAPSSVSIDVTPASARPLLFQPSSLSSRGRLQSATEDEGDAAARLSSIAGSVRNFSNDSRSSIDGEYRIPLLKQMEKVIRPACIQSPKESLGSIMDKHLKYNTLLDLIPPTLTPAIRCPASGEGSSPPALTHQRLRLFLERESPYSSFGLGVGSRVAVLLPNGPCLALAVLSSATFCVCAPINPQQTGEELLAEVKGLGCEAAICVLPENLGGGHDVGPDLAPHRLPSSTIELLAKDGVMVLGLCPTFEAAGLFKLFLVAAPESGAFQPFSVSGKENLLSRPNKRGDVVLVLHTSGTSGSKKVVPYNLENLVVGAACVAESWALGPTDVDLNQMPMYHIGGIARNLFAPILAGGATIFCAGFDPVLFWNEVEADAASDKSLPTWYYAAPTMHMMILAEGRRRCAENPQTIQAAKNIRMVCNAAGGLLPSLAKELSVMFPSSVILPSYGMTECMPISTPRQDYALDRPGTSGVACGPEIAICDDEGNILKPNENGNICVRGPPLMHGYFNNDKANKESFFKNGFFNTGDKGHLDADGYIYLTGRSKEVINRGGEIISPFDVEEALVQHPCVKEVIAFSSPDATLQEVVGVAIATKPGMPRPDLKTLHNWVAKTLHPAKWPQVLVFLDDIPKNSTNKVLRINVAQRCGIPEMNDSIPLLRRIYENQPGKCPPKGAALSVSIPCRQCAIDATYLEAVCGVMKALDGVVDAHSRFEEAASQNGKNTGVIATLAFTVEGIEAAKAKGNANTSLQKVIENAIVFRLQEEASKSGNPSLHSYAFPAKFEIVLLESGGRLPMSRGQLDIAAVAKLEKPVDASVGKDAKMTPVQATLAAIFCSITDSDANEMDVDTDFFAVGGDSLKAGMLNGMVRKRFNVTLPTGSVFNSRTIGSLSELIEKLMPAGGAAAGGGAGSAAEPSAGSGQPFHGVSYNHLTLMGSRATDFQALIIQILPITVIYPFFRSVQWFLFVFALMYSKKWVKKADKNGHVIIADDDYWYWYDDDDDKSPTVNDDTTVDDDNQSGADDDTPPTRLLRVASRRLSGVQGYDGYSMLVLQFLFAMFVSKFFTYVVMPNVGILMKWILIGRYKEGRYPLFGWSYLMWWLSSQILRICGRGFYLSDGRLHVLYHRLLGAKIGKNVKLSPHLELCESDLVSIGDNCVIDHATIRPFCLETGLMVLSRIEIGANCSIGIKSCIAPGAVLKEGTVVGPLSSSHEIMEDEKDPAAAEQNKKSRMVNRQTFPAPSFWTQWLLGTPILYLMRCFGGLPYIVGVLPLVLVLQSFVPFAKGQKDALQAYLEWFALPERVLYFIVVRAIVKVLSPLFYLGACIALKRCFIGKFKAGEWGKSFRSRFSYWLVRELLPGRDFGGASHIVGTHYQVVSSIYRALGANIGNRIYWPGSGIDIVEFDLLTIEDDAVFGSRSLMLAGDSASCSPIKIRQGAMVADRCLLLPGVTLGKNAVLGSGCITQRGATYESGSIHLGSAKGAPILWDAGDQKVAEETPSLTPFAKAYYKKEAPYMVMSLWMHITLNVTVAILWAAFWVLPLLASVQVVVHVEKHYLNSTYRWDETFGIFFITFCVVNLLSCIVALGFVISAKWILIGRRKAGPCNWNSSSYCQRWQVYLVLEKMRQKCMGGRGILDFVCGSAYLVWYFRLLGGDIGENVCLYPNGGDPMMTEPDLVKIGDNACIDDASLIAHINSKGQFSLNPLSVGDNCTMRYGTRLLSGASMEKGSIMLEHTLILSGEVLDENTVWQGWPGRIVGRK